MSLYDVYVYGAIGHLLGNAFVAVCTLWTEGFDEKSFKRLTWELFLAPIWFLYLIFGLCNVAILIHKFRKGKNTTSPTDETKEERED